MKAIGFLLIGLLGFSVAGVRAGEAPQGSLIEVHSCEVYAGPCVVNSESPQEGRCMIRAWTFTGGAMQGTSLKGLDVAVLQISSDNLAAPGSRSGNAIVYLPQDSTRSQQDALLAWVKSQKDFEPSQIQKRLAPLHFSKSENGYGFSAGNFISVKTSSLRQCQMGGCGEVLWYQPRTATALFTVADNKGTTVNEPLLDFKWNDGGERSVFLGRFGPSIGARNVYVSLAELCGATKAAF